MRIYLFRGLFGDAFSTGMDRLAEKLSAAGHKTSVHRWLERPSLVREVLEDIEAGRLSGPFAVVGHSLGGNSASRMGHALKDAGADIRYIATVDATAPLPAPGGGVASDNFRSSDWRDEAVPGSTEFDYSDVNHIEIDKDPRVHGRVLEMATRLDGPPAGAPASVPVFETSAGQARAFDPMEEPAPAMARAATAAGVSGSEDLRELLAKLAAELQETRPASPDARPDAGPDAGQVAGQGAEAAGAPQLTPVNAALGQTLGKLLDGRKTGIGVIGLLALTVLPVFFPGLAPIKSLLESLGVTNPQLVGAGAEAGKSLLGPIFAALTAWGLLGKTEKWVEK
jgi:hypothetical protein